MTLPTFLFGWPWGTWLEPIEIPDGDWRLYLFVIALYRQRVSRPTRGMEGPGWITAKKMLQNYFLTALPLPF